jgi:epoxyqueuosine reductase QueG
MTTMARKSDRASSLSTAQLKRRLARWGADISGVADLEPFREYATIPAGLLEGYTRAVSIAVRVPAGVFETVGERPTPLYAAVYLTANRLLDDIAFRAAALLQDEGFRSLPIPASQVLDREHWRRAISHKAVARMAGVGWQGKNLLLVTREYGSRVRLVTVLTDAPLAVDGPVKNRCGSCTACRDACPSGAIRGVGTRDRYASREEALVFERCRDRLTLENAKLPDVGVPICGVCIRVCPFGTPKTAAGVR